MTNPVTGNRLDAVAEAFARYEAEGGVLSFPEWHDRQAPSHPVCNVCRRGRGE
jgi:hypothetical protein